MSSNLTLSAESSAVSSLLHAEATSPFWAPGVKDTFSIATIQHYVDPLGKYNGGTPQNFPLAQATDLKASLNYARGKGGEIVMHGYTHQYGSQANLHTGVSRDDYEFWNIVANTPVAEDATSWALARLMAGLGELAKTGYQPVAWEMPHYQGSALSNKAASQVSRTTYQRVVYYTADKPNFNAAVSKDFAVGQVFPYVIQRDYYGQRVLSESLDNIEYDIRAIDPTSNLQLHVARHHHQRQIRADGATALPRSSSTSSGWSGNWACRGSQTSRR